MPSSGESQIENAGIPLIATQRACTRSNAKMLGTKYTEAVVSRNSLRSSSIRGAVQIGNARYTRLIASLRTKLAKSRAEQFPVIGLASISLKRSELRKSRKPKNLPPE